MAELMDVSQAYIDSTDIEKRKKLGQYFTCSSIRAEVMKLLPKMKNPRVLEPACGTGEFLQSIYDYFEGPVVDAFDIDARVVGIASKSFPKANIQKTDALNLDFGEIYDFVIGNPPYFETILNKKQKAKFKEILGGRPNMYALFIKLGLDALKPGGYLAYVVPPSMNNGAFFAKLRKYIVGKANIECIKLLDSDHFEGAQQNVMILILKKGANRGNFIFQKGDISIFSTKADYLNKQFKNKLSLKEAGFSVKTGSVVWNQNKDLLSDSKEETLLVWAHNIQDGKIELGNKNKKQYVKLSGTKDKAIVVNRITGAGENATLRAAIVDGKKEWVAENHVNVITETENAKVDIESICSQITSNRALKIIRSITGNTQISKTELENLIPIDIKGTNSEQ